MTRLTQVMETRATGVRVMRMMGISATCVTRLARMMMGISATRVTRQCPYPRSPVSRLFW